MKNPFSKPKLLLGTYDRWKSCITQSKQFNKKNSFFSIYEQTQIFKRWPNLVCGLWNNEQKELFENCKLTYCASLMGLHILLGKNYGPFEEILSRKNYSARKFGLFK